MSEQTFKRADRKSDRNNKKCAYKVICMAVMASLLAAAMVVFGNPNEAEDVEDIFSRGGAAVLLSQGTLDVAYENDEDIPDVGEEAFRKLVKWCHENLKLTSIAALVQTVPDEAVANGDGTYTLTVPVNALLINGVESEDRLALYAVVRASDEIGAELVEIAYETSADELSGSVKLLLPSPKILLIIDQKGDGESETTTAEVKIRETSTETENMRETQPTQIRQESTTAEENKSMTAEYADGSEDGTDVIETKQAGKQTVTHSAEKNVSPEVESTTSAYESNMAGVYDESPVTGGHDF
jgi:hypothetical protein